MIFVEILLFVNFLGAYEVGNDIEFTHRVGAGKITGNIHKIRFFSHFYILFYNFSIRFFGVFSVFLYFEY